MSFDEFGADLASGLSEKPQEDMHTQLMLAEVRIGCTLALLQCLNREARLTYILGEILELDHQEAAVVLDISQAAYRKRLSRGRADVVNFMMGHCGLVQPDNPCRCSKRVAPAQKLGRIDPDNLVFSSSTQIAQKFPEILREIRKLDVTQRAAAIYRAQTQPTASESYIQWLRTTLQNH